MYTRLEGSQPFVKQRTGRQLSRGRNGAKTRKFKLAVIKDASYFVSKDTNCLKGIQKGISNAASHFVLEDATSVLTGISEKQGQTLLKHS